MAFYPDKFRRAREQQRWTIINLAKRCNISRQSLTSWESGKRIPGEEHIRKLARILEVPLSTISNLQDEAPRSRSSTLSTNLGSLLESAKCTEKKRIEEYNLLTSILEKQKSQYEQVSTVVKALIDSSNSIFYVKDIGGKYIIVNKAFLQNLALDPDYEVAGKTDYNFFKKVEARDNHEEDLAVMASSVPLHNLERYVLGSKKKKWGLTSKIPIFENGNVIGMMGNIVDVTEQREKEIIHKLISESIDKLEAALSVYDIKKNKCIYTNNECRKIFGIDEKVPDKDILSFWLKNIVHPDDREEQKLCHSMAQKGEIPQTRTYRIKHPKKGIRTIRVISTDIINFLNGTYIASLSVDITEQES